MKKMVLKMSVYCSLIFGLFNVECRGMNDIYNIKDSNSTSSSRSSISSSSSEEWIASNKELIQKACYEESSFDSLIDEIEKFSDCAKDRRELYEEIENTWNDKNVFGAVMLDNGTFVICDAEHFD